MNKIKLILVFLVMFIVVGCGNKTMDSVSPEQIYSILSREKYDVIDVTDRLAFSEAAYLVDDNVYIINYVKTKNNYDVQGIFLDEVNNILLKAKEGYTKKSDSGDSWANLRVYDENKYYFIGWIKDSYITVECNIKYKDKMNDLVKELGYL